MSLPYMVMCHGEESLPVLWNLHGVGVYAGSMALSRLRICYARSRGRKRIDSVNGELEGEEATASRSGERVLQEG